PIGGAQLTSRGGSIAQPCAQASQCRHRRARRSSVSSTTRVAGFAPPSTRVGVRGHVRFGVGREGPGSGADYPCPMSARAVPVPLQQLPNALTIGRLALIPVFVALMLAADGGHSW